MKSKKIAVVLKSDDINEFRDAGLLWFVNRIIHIFGWAIAVAVDDKDRCTGEIKVINVKYRGFEQKEEDRGYGNVGKYMAENAKRIHKESGL